jgi:hypothetical protein
VTAALLGIVSAASGVLGAILGDLLSEEVRHRLDRIPLQLARLACRRLPEPVRTDRADEWVAELSAILARRGATKLPITRLALGVRFALGLFIATPAMRRAVERGHRRRGMRPLGITLVALAVGGFMLVVDKQLDLALLLAEVLELTIVLRILFAAARQRDQDAAAAALALTPMAALFIVDIARRVQGDLPAMASVIVVVLLVWQPYLAARIARRMQPLRPAFRLVIVAVCSLSTAIVVPAPRPFTPVILLAGIGPVAVMHMIAGTITVVGSIHKPLPEHRLKVAITGGATVLLGAALANLCVQSLVESSLAYVVASRAIALTAASGYLIAVTPPRWMRLPWDRRYSAPSVQSPGPGKAPRDNGRDTIQLAEAGEGPTPSS